MALPPELLRPLLDNLDWTSVKTLRQSCRAFGHNLMPKPLLLGIYYNCAERLHHEEKGRLKAIEVHDQDSNIHFPDAEEYYLNAHSSSSGSRSLHDPDLIAEAQAKLCASDILPCYTCLRWLPSYTDRRFAGQSSFTRARSTGVFDLAASHCRGRVCIECGMRAGVYVRGNIVKHSVICRQCGRLGVELQKEAWGGPRRNVSWQAYVFCEMCQNKGEGEIDGLAKLQLLHAMRFGKYERGILAGRMRRAMEGKKRRAEAGIVDGEAENKLVMLQGELCPVTGGPQLCYCFRQVPRFCESFDRGWLDDPSQRAVRIHMHGKTESLT